MPDLPPHLAGRWDAVLEGRGDDRDADELLAWIAVTPAALPGLRRDAGLDAALRHLLADPDGAGGFNAAVMRRIRDERSLHGGKEFSAQVMARIPRRSPARRAWTRWLPLAIASGIVVVVAAALLLRPGGAGRDAGDEGLATPLPAIMTERLTAHGAGVSVGGRLLAPATAVEVAPGTGIDVDDASAAELRLRDGTTIALLGGTRFAVAAADHGHRLERGSLAIEATHRPPARAFAVVTPHATIRVVGTVFRVDADAIHTWVGVSRGSVAIEAAGARTLVDPGHELVVDGRGPGPVRASAGRNALDIGQARINPLQHPSILGIPSGTYHGLATRPWTYAGAAGRPAGFAELFWDTRVPPGARQLRAWFKPGRVVPDAGAGTAALAVLVSMPAGDFVVAELHLKPDDRGWLPLSGTFADMRLNWSLDPGAPAQPEVARVDRVALRLLNGQVEGIITGVLFEP